MTLLIATILVLVNAAWFLLVLVRLPGVWLMVLTTWLVAWWRWEQRMFSPWTLGVILLLAAASEVIEFLAGAVGTRKAGGSSAGAWGAVFGGILGAVLGTVLIPLPVLNSVLGACLGAWLGASGIELSTGRPAAQAMRSGAGASAGTLAGILTKVVTGIVVWLIIAAAAFWP